MVAALGLGLAAVITACERSASQTAISGSAVSPQTQATASAAAIVPGDGLTGFGAAVPVWNEHHTADTRYTPGSVYNPNSDLPSYVGRDDYIAVTPQDGRITDYTMLLLGQPIHDAIARALKELPPDAHELWGTRRDTCYQAELVSKTLGRVLGAAPFRDPEGEVFVELDTILPDGSSVYKRDDVNEIMFTLIAYPNAASAMGC